jgi:hypothetical protein
LKKKNTNYFFDLFLFIFAAFNDIFWPSLAFLALNEIFKQRTAFGDKYKQI